MSDASASILDELRRRLPELSGREARAARHLMANYPMAGLTTVAELAVASGVSTATVLRLVRRLGFPVYGDFQAALRAHLEETLQSPLIRIAARRDGEPATFLDRFLDTVAAQVQELRASTPTDDFARVVALLADPRRDIHVIGGRYSSRLAGYFADLLGAVRGRVRAVGGQTQTWPQRLLDMGRGSVLVVFDVRRYQADVIEFARGADRRGATVVLLTDTWQSPAARAADHVLGFPVGSPSVFDVLTLGMALAEALVGAVALRLGDAARERIAALEELRDPFGPDSREDQR